MNDLHRELAPLSVEAWNAIDETARSALEVTLAGRKLVDFVGPRGWSLSAVGLGRVRPLGEPPQPGVTGALRVAQPLVELVARFSLARAELEAAARGARDPDLDPVRLAAKAMAQAENRAVFHGYPAGGIRGISEVAEAEPVRFSPDYEAYPGAVAKAVAQLKMAGVDGPYAIALGPRCYSSLAETTTKGYPVLEHVRRLVDGPLIWAPAVDGAVVLSQRGGDFELTVGRDFSVGYLGHTHESVELYLQESLTFRVLGPEAAVLMVHASE